MEEIFKDIEGYEQLYQISNLGRVKSLGNGGSNSKEKVLKPAKLKNNYLQVVLSKQGKLKHHLVHRLVAQAFLDNPNNLPEVNHRDEDKTNNCIENLEWCDTKYNINYGTRNKRVCEKNKISQKNDINKSKQVLCVETGKIYPSTRDVARQLGFSQGNISNVCNGIRKTAYKFHWCYV